MICGMMEVKENNGVVSGKEVGSPLLDRVVREGLSEEVIIKLGPKMQERVNCTKIWERLFQSKEAARMKRTPGKGKLDMFKTWQGD